MGGKNLNLSRLSPAARARALGLPPEGDGSGDDFRRGILDRERGLPEDPNGSLAYRRGYRSSFSLSGIRREREEVREVMQELLRAEPKRPTHEDRLQQLFQILKRAAVEHAPCPTNEYLASQLGFSSHGGVIPLLNELVEMNLIAIHRHGGNLRSIEIVGMGIRTAVSDPGGRRVIISEEEE